MRLIEGCLGVFDGVIQAEANLSQNPPLSPCHYPEGIKNRLHFGQRR